MTRKLALCLVVALGSWHAGAQALGLGEIDVDSALNQRFSAEIVLRNTENLEADEIVVSLASTQDFERVGVQRFFYLADLRFTTDLSDPDRPVVNVTSSQPITEPFLNFVVQLLWPSGRLLREYTVLLDPPTYAQRPLTAPSAPTTATPRTPPPPTSTVRPADPAPSPALGVVDDGGRGAFTGDSYGVTDRNDTLWDIALQVRPDDDVSAQQTMLALLRLNPEAFIDGNINRLKAGYVLRVPSAEEVRRLSFQDAVVQVAEQNERWRQRLDGAPLDARNVLTDRRPAASEGQLRLVSGEDGAPAGGGDPAGPAGGGAGAPGGAAPADAARLAQADAAAEQARAEAAAAAAELDDAQARIDELQRELEVRNDRIAQMQAVLQRQQEAQESRAQAPASAADRSAPASAGPFGLGWTVLGGGLAVLVLILVGVLAALRRRSAGAQDAPVAVDDIEAPAPQDVDKTQLMPALSAADLGGSGGDEAEDPIEQADLYLAYGRFSDAARVLGTAIEAEPQRADLRLKLMEVSAETGDVDAFNEHGAALAGFADAETIAAGDAIAARLPGAMSSQGEITEGEVAPRDDAGDGDGEMSLDFDLGSDEEAAADLDSLGLDLDEPATPGSGTAETSEDDDGMGDIEFDIDLDLDDESTADVDEDLALDLDGDEPSATSTEDAGLDFDLGEDDGDTAAKSADDDEDLALDLAGEGRNDDGDDDLALDLAGEEGGDDDLAGALGGVDAADDEPESGAPAGIDFDLDLDGDDDGDRDDAQPPASKAAGEEELDFDIDDLAGDDRLSGSGSNDPAAPAAADADDLDFDLDDLAGGSGDPAAAVDGSDDGPDDEAEADDDDGGLSLADLEDDSDASDLLGDLDAASKASGGDEGGDDLDFDFDDDLDFGDDDGDEIATKLELARAYVDMGDEDGAREILDEVVRDGDDGQKQQAGTLLEQIG